MYFRFMKQQRYYYLIRIQYLGFRFHGWQKQPTHKTVEGMIQRTLNYVFEGNMNFKILGAGRTDAMVSATHAAFELFVDHPLEDIPVFMDLFNKNLPPDIRATDIKMVDEHFNIIQHAKQKEYVYLFSHGKKNHPFAAPFIANIVDTLNIEQMKAGAKLFEGTHNFKAYTVRPSKKTQFERTIDRCEILPNDLHRASFFPDESFALHVHGAGFLRYQIRMIAGALIALGKGELSLNDIERSLQANSNVNLEFVAPASGLSLNNLEFE
ncbi:tRNA pseudouridine(38-40) synthase TruA [Sungkyunkwania multivorans]|uniref:tRNA pseudouridine synthase A n=1 Tax=Sungkyunkwania multivorans TaxID=1173618 RepID=A0ABW3CW00_9FLAO